MRGEAVENKLLPGEWQAEAVNYEGDGEVYVTIFAGPDAEARAKEYCFDTRAPQALFSQDEFFAKSSIQELARAQRVSPLNDPGVLSGGIPDEEDVAELLKEIYGARR
jgi:hypothetical protein